MRKRDPDRVHRRQPQRLVVGGRGECLDATEDGGHRLVGDPDDVVQRLLCRLGAAERVAEDVGAQALGVLCVEAGLEELVPHPPSGAELGDLLEDVKVSGQEQEDRRRERIDVQARARVRRRCTRSRSQARSPPPGWRWSPSRGCGSRRIRWAPTPASDGAVLDDVDRELQRRARGEDVGPAGEVLLQHVVLEQDPKAVGRVTRATLQRR